MFKKLLGVWMALAALMVVAACTTADEDQTPDTDPTTVSGGQTVVPTGAAPGSPATTPTTTSPGSPQTTPTTMPTSSLPTASTSGTPTTQPQGGGGGGSTEWCNAGASWSTEGVDVPGVDVQNARIIGMTEFKGGNYCQAEFEAQAGGTSSVITYYFNEDQQDVWVVLDVGGNKQELHIRDGVAQ